MTASGGTAVRCFQGILILGTLIIGLSGLALTAECIYFVSDQHGLHPLLQENDDIYAAAWIGIFTGFSFFLLSILGICGIMKSNRRILMVYLILVAIVFIFEAASSITAATHRDYLTQQFFLKEMLQRYQGDISDPTNVKVTSAWNTMMLLKNCCGVNGPVDWLTYSSAFRNQNPDSSYPWPQQCCIMDQQGKPLNLDGCRVGLQGYLKMTGCFDSIMGPLNRHAWGVAWFGFAILCWTFWFLLGTMFYWTHIEC